MAWNEDSGPFFTGLSPSLLRGGNILPSSLAYPLLSTVDTVGECFGEMPSLVWEINMRLGWLDSMPGVVSIDRRGAKNACLHHPRLMKRVTQAKTESFIKKDVLTLPT